MTSDAAQLDDFLAGATGVALLPGDAATVLATLPDGLVDTCLTSPPYWGQRAYDNADGFGQERTPEAYVARLVGVGREIRRVLKPEGSLWLNLGDTYRRKRLLGLPWRVALALQEEGWILRNAVVWDKEKGNPCHASDKLRNVHELIFHLVRQDRYRYDLDGNHTIFPTYDVYLIEASGSIYKLQVTSYYSVTGAARHVTFRYARLDS